MLNLDGVIADGLLLGLTINIFNELHVHVSLMLRQQNWNIFISFKLFHHLSVVRINWKLV